MKTNKTFRLNIPISKVDEEQRVVTGIATNETLDSQGDIVDYEASKKAFSEWPGNIREMHGPVTIGKGIDVQCDDKTKSVIVSAKISESADGENAWIKVKEKILTGFSIGGKVFEVAKDKTVEGASRVLDYSLSELSLVDNPANPDAELLMVKSVKGGLQRVETGKGLDVLPQAWWVNKFMKPQMTKNVYTAAEALSLATQLTWLISQEADEPDRVSDLITAFNAIRDFVGKEVAEGDDFQNQYAEIVELANKAINLRKEKLMPSKKVEKTNVVAGEERDEEANVTETAEQAGRPVNDTQERADAAKVPEAGAPVDEKGKKVDEAEAVDVQAPVKAEGADEKVEEPIEEPAKEEAAPEKSVEGEAKAPEEKKSSDTTTLLKNVETLLTKLNDEQGTAELKKMTETIKADIGKVAKSMTVLEDRVKAIEDQPLPTKGQRYQVVAKGEEDSEVDADTKELLKRQEELMANPNDAKPGEAYELAMKLRKASIGEPITVN